MYPFLSANSSLWCQRERFILIIIHCKPVRGLWVDLKSVMKMVRIQGTSADTSRYFLCVTLAIFRANLTHF